MLVLASASPRRRELLAQAGFTFTVHPAHIPEEPRDGEDPVGYVTRLAREKAEAVFAALSTSTCAAPQVLGADTTVTLDNQMLGKPADPADAARMLRLLSGRTHLVTTGIALITAHCTEVAAEATAVRFLTLSDEEIADYIKTGEPMDKAGAYAIQGRAARWIPRIEGCYFNVVGLPLALVTAMLESINSAPYSQNSSPLNDCTGERASRIPISSSKSSQELSSRARFGAFPANAGEGPALKTSSTPT